MTVVGTLVAETCGPTRRGGRAAHGASRRTGGGRRSDRRPASHLDHDRVRSPRRPPRRPGGRLTDGSGRDPGTATCGPRTRPRRVRRTGVPVPPGRRRGQGGGRALRPSVRGAQGPDRLAGLSSRRHRAAGVPAGHGRSAGRHRSFRARSSGATRVSRPWPTSIPSPRSSRPTTSAAPCPTSSTPIWPSASARRSPGSWPTADGADRVLVGPRHAPQRASSWPPRSPRACSGQGLDVVDLGLASTDLVYFAAGTLDAPGRHVHRVAQPGPVQRHQAVPGRRPPGRRGHRAGRDQGAWPHDGVPAPPDEPRPVSTTLDLLGDFADHVRSLRRRRRRSRPLKVVADTANGMGGLVVPRGVRRPAVRPRGAVRRARRHLPEPPGRPDPAREPARPAGPGARGRAPTSAWPSTATPTGCSSSTSRASRCRARPPPRSSPRACSRSTRARRSSTT